MDKQITIRELYAPEDVERFWQELHTYFRRDILTDSDGSEDLAYFTGEAYRETIRRLHQRARDPLFYLFFQREGRDIGFAIPVLYGSEDGKCFILEFCVFPEFRGGGTGRACAQALLDWGRRKGAAYFELNADTAQRRRFWGYAGFQPNGADEWGKPLLLLPPEEDVPFTVEVLADPEDPDLGWQLHKLENGFLAEIDEETLTDEQKARLAAAIREERITFFLIRRGYRAVGMCSVSRCFSTFTCAAQGVFDDFYVEPVFRRRGAARQLVDFVRQWCAGRDIVSLAVGCSPVDEEMYAALGFTTRLGTMLACRIG